MKKIILGIALFLFCVSPVFAVGLNGSFENGTDPGATFITVNVGGTDIFNWTVDSGSVDYIGGLWEASNGYRSIDLNGLSQGSISQTLTTVLGGTYNVTFDLSGNPGSLPREDQLWSPTNKVLRVSDGVNNQDYSYDTATEGNSYPTPMKWMTGLTYSFVATGPSTTLTFASQIIGAFGPVLDNVAITETLPKAIATGGLTLSGPRQQISFNAFDYGDSSLDKGHVQYQNFEYPGRLHYTADVLCANVNPTDHKAWFMFQIPEGFPGLSELYVVSYVFDGGSPGTKGDIYGHTASADLATATSWCENGNAPDGYYTVAGGNAVVHK